MNTSKTFSAKDIGGLIGCLAICYFIAWTGAQVSPSVASPEWYNELSKPEWNSPAWIFGPVWALLYTFMGFAAWHIWKKYGFKDAQPELILFLIQLGLNGLWSQLFFGMQNPGVAFIEIFFLIAAIIITTVLFFRKSTLSGWLMIPYILWVGFATALNGAIWKMN